MQSRENRVTVSTGRTATVIRFPDKKDTITSSGSKRFQTGRSQRRDLSPDWENEKLDHDYVTDTPFLSRVFTCRLISGSGNYATEARAAVILHHDT